MNSIQRKLPVSVLMGISLLGFLGLTPAAAESSNPLPVYVDATNTDRLQSVLNARGWDAQFDASGSLIAQYPHERIPESHQQLPLTFEHFAKALADRGWSATLDDGGNLILRPYQSVAETVDHSHIAQERSTQTSADSLTRQQWPRKLPQLSQRLESVGWQTDFTHNGDLIVHLPNRQSAKHAESKQAFQAPVQSDMDRLANQLNSSGWITYRDETGSLIFSRPPLHTSQVSTDQRTAFEGKAPVPTLHHRAPGGIQKISKRNDLFGLRKAAENGGWSLSHDADGGLLLVPFG